MNYINKATEKIFLSGFSKTKDTIVRWVSMDVHWIIR